jgi:hypothetical protein
MEVLMNQPQRTILLGAVLLSTISAQPASDPSGHWEGSIEAPTADVNFEVDLAKNSQGELTGTFGNTGENLKGLPLSNISVDGKSLRFQIKGAPGERAFKGTISDDGKSIAGDYSQRGYTIPFSLTRTGDAKFEAAVKNAAIGKELEGVWNGTLDADGKQLRAVLTLSNQPDGTASGNIVSVDEGLDIPIATITQRASSLTLDLKAVGASFSGDLKPDATELAGKYTQGSLVLPVTFRRSTATEGNK